MPWTPAVVSASPGIGSFEERNVPSAHESAEATTSSTPETVASPPGRRRSATPMNPKAVPTSEARGGLSPVVDRSTTSQSGTEAKIRDASPIGTCRSAAKRIALAPINRTPQSTVDPAVTQPSLNGVVPCRRSSQVQSRTPTVVKRTPAAKIGGIVSPASSIPR
jgi:hypothetical protein